MTRNVSYLPKWALVGLAIVVSHHIVAETQNTPTATIIRQSNYYVAMAFSCPFTYLLMWWIHYVVKRLDVKVPWQVNWFRRLLFQFTFCVVLVIAIDLMMVRAYFWAFNNDFSSSGYMQTEIWIVFWMVLCMNAGYTAWFFSKNFFHGLNVNRSLKAHLEQVVAGHTTSSVRIEARLGNKMLQVSLNEIACFERHENIGLVHLKSGKIYYVDLTMPVLLELLSKEGFYQINRSILISLSVISGYEKFGQTQLKVLLVEGVDLEVSLEVSRSRVKGFKNALTDFNGG